MDKFNHPYFLASSKINFSTNFYKKYILSQKGGKTIGNNNFTYHLEKLRDMEGFFLGKSPHCVDVFIDQNEAIIHNFSYFDNCSIKKDFPRKIGTQHLMNTTLQYISKNYPDVKNIFLTDMTTIQCGHNKFPMCYYLLLMYGITYYTQYGFKLKYNKNDINLINKKILETKIDISTINDFINENNFSHKNNESFLELCKYLLDDVMDLRDFLKEIRFIKDDGKKNCNYFFTFIQFIYFRWFSGFNFFQKEYILNNFSLPSN